jgi:DNA-binding response OmpR family regulator
MTALSIERPVALVVEQDDKVRVMLGDNLTADGLEVITAGDAGEGLRLAGRHAPDVAVVGVNGGSGRDFAKVVRAGESGVDRRLPMVLLGGDQRELDTLRAFQAGADDYMAREGFSYPVLYARVRALLRRVELDQQTRERVRRAGGVTIDGATRVATIEGGPPISLTKHEFSLLWALAGDPLRIFAKEELLRIMGNRASGSLRTVDSHASRLRKKLGNPPGVVVGRWGAGYSLLAAESAVTL